MFLSSFFVSRLFYCKNQTKPRHCGSKLQNHFQTQNPNPTELGEGFEKTGCIAQAIKCLEAICQSHVSFLPIVEVKTRLRIATLLLQHTDNITQAKTHLERAQLLLKQIPACFELKCRAYSLLSRCYLLVGTISSVKQTLRKGIELSSSAGTGYCVKSPGT